MTMNDSWGYQRGRRRLENAQDHRSQPGHLRARQRQLPAQHRTQAGWLDSRGIRASILTAVGKWMERNGQTIYQSESCQPRRSNYAGFTRKGNTLYMHVYFWPGSTVALGGLMNKVKSARLLATGKEVKFEQEKFRVRFLGLPEKAPDDPGDHASPSNATASRARIPIASAKTARASGAGCHPAGGCQPPLFRTYTHYRQADCPIGPQLGKLPHIAPLPPAEPRLRPLDALPGRQRIRVQLQPRSAVAIFPNLLRHHFAGKIEPHRVRPAPAKAFDRRLG